MQAAFCTMVFLVLLVGGLVIGCGNDCHTLTKESCAQAGGDSVTCSTRTAELEELGQAKERLCGRALVLYRSLPEND